MKKFIRRILNLKPALIGVLLFSHLVNSSLLSAGSSAQNFREKAQFVEMEAKIANEEIKKITSVLVQHKQKMVYENYFNNGSVNFLNDIRSASKSLTSVLFGRALGDREFPSVKSTVTPYFKDKRPFAYPYAAKADISFEDLLTMSSSLECNDWAQYSAGNEERMYLRKDWEQFVLDLPERGIPPWEPKLEDSKYGRSFSYCTGGVFLIGSAIERVTGKRLDQYAHEKLFGAMKIDNLKWPESPMGIIQGGGGLQIRSQDLIKIGQLILNRGEYDGKQLIDKNWVKEMLTPRVVAVAERNIEYGYLWWIYNLEVKDRKITAYAASGNGGNYLFVVPELELVTVITSQAYNTRYMHKQSLSIFTDSVLPVVLESTEH